MPNQKKKQKQSKIYPAQEVVTFDALAKKYQGKLDKLLNKKNTEKKVNEVLNEYSEEVENLFLVDKDSNEHKIIKIRKEHKKSPYLLDLSKVKEKQELNLEKEVKKYRKTEVKRKEIKLEAIKKIKKANKVKTKKKVRKAEIRNIDGSLKKKRKKISKIVKKKKEFYISDKELDAQIVKFNFWRYWWYRNAKYLSRMLKGFAFLIIIMFSIAIFAWSNMIKVNDALEFGEKAIYSLDEIKEDVLAKDWKSIEFKLQKSTRYFILAQGKLQQVSPVMKLAFKFSPYVGKKFNSIENLLNGAVSLGLAGSSLFSDLQEVFLSVEEKSFDLKLKEFINHLAVTNLLLTQGNNYLQEIDVKYFPKEYGNNILEMQIALPYLLEMNKYVLEYKNDLLDLLGHKHARRYLFLFQNNKELRPTGGFMGSMALIDIDQAGIKNIEIPGGGLYDYQGSLTKNLISPVPLQILRSRWYFHDSNWFSDFPYAAEKISWFLENSGGPSVDGVVTINFSVLEDLIRFFGPVELAEYDKTLDSNNLWIELQKSVELEYDIEENKPKAIIGDLFEVLLGRVVDTSDQEKLKLAQIVLKNMWQKEIMFYSKNENIEKLINIYNLGGQISQKEGDYLMLVNANIGGAKTDAVIKQDIDHQLLIKSDGSLIVTVKINRKHNGEIGNLFTGIPNVNYMQLYVPKGSELITANGFSEIPKSKFQKVEDFYEVDEDLASLYKNVKTSTFSNTGIHDEFGKTVFSNWVITEVGEESELTFMYELPFTMEDLKTENGFYQYNLNIQKQSGDLYTDIEHSFVLNPKYNIKWSYPVEKDAHYEYKLSHDYDITLLIEE